MPRYDVQALVVRAHPTYAADAKRVANLDHLVQLSVRWTQEFKAEYLAKQKELQKLIVNGHMRRSRAAIKAKIREGRDGLVEDRAYYEVHREVLRCLTVSDRLEAWISGL
jgi:hypothetical protein